MIQRGSRLYDKKNHTYVFTAAPYCDLIYFLSWDELPEVLRNYIKISATRIYQDSIVGSDTLHGFTAEEEQKAHYQLKEAEAEQLQATIFDNWDIGSIVYNRRRPIR